MRRSGNIWFGWLAVLAPLMALPAHAQQQKPNVVFILADNVGYGDLGSYGGGELRGAPTPRLDQLAREGLRLTQFLVEPACTPSRAALMTGQYSIRNGLSLVLVPGSVNSLSASAFTMGTCSTALDMRPRYSENGISARTRTACRLRMALMSTMASRPDCLGMGPCM